MKRIISLILCVIMVLSVTALVGCDKKDGALKFGFGVYSVVEKANSATEDADGVVEANTTAAVILVDADGKIVDCKIDTMQAAMSFTAKGEAMEAAQLKTKYERGDDYGMKTYTDATKEWYEQADAFCALVKGKTATEVKALVANSDMGTGTDDVIKAGCTIGIADFVKALEKAFANLKASTATTDCKVNLGFASTQAKKTDATDDAEGANEIDTTVVGTVLDKDGKIVIAATDAVQAKASFDTKGATTIEKGEIATKGQLGENYGMSKYGQDLNGDGKVKEWNEQGAAFDAALVGKKASEIAALAIDTGYGAESLQTAGCTIHVGDMVKAAVKAATV